MEKATTIEVPINKKNLCSVCEAPASSTCAACKSVFYCTREHQRKDWKIHKAACVTSQKKISFPFVITTAADDDDDPLLGKQWEAARDLKAGELLLDEIASVTSFVWDDSPSISAPSGFDSSMCLVCAAYNPSYVCRKCKWPVCKKTCEHAKIHTENECKIFMNNKISYPPSSSQHISPAPVSFMYLLYFIRALVLKQQQPETYKEILELTEYPGGSDESSREDGDVVDSVIKLLSEIVSFEEMDTDQEELKKLYRIHLANSFSANCKTGSSGVSCLFLQASRMNHSCIPNCSWEIGQVPDYKLRVRTTVDVKKGEPLTLCYFEAFRSYGTRQRQLFLRQNRGFICRCRRCKDPAELQTLFSAVVCQACRPKGKFAGEGHLCLCSGYLLPHDPLNLDDGAVWECNRCHATKVAKEIEEIVAKCQFSADFAGIKLRDSYTLKQFIRQLEKVDEPRMKRILHLNHYIFQEAAEKIYSCFAARPPILFDAKVCAFFGKHLKFLMRSQNIVNRGVSFTRANLLHEIAWILEHEYTNSTSMTGAARLHKLKESIAVAEEAYPYFKNSLPEIGSTMSMRCASVSIMIHASRIALKTACSMYVRKKVGC